MIVVNLFGAPGAGKSTGAAYVFSQLKMKGINAELVTEFAKDKVYEETKEVWNNQVYIFGKQYFRLSRVDKKVDVVITDSPLFNAAYYNHDVLLGTDFNRLVLKIFNSFDNLNFFIQRDKPYNPKGRFQTEEDSNDMQKEIVKFLDDYNVEYYYMLGNEKNYDFIVESVMTILEAD
jgi:hypothetical protein